MPSQIFTTGVTTRSLKDTLRAAFNQTKPKAIGIAVAYVSASGFEYINELATTFKAKHLRLVTDTKDAVTHPTALSTAMKRGWETRIVDQLLGTFHPKLYVGGDSFSEESGLSGASLFLVSSANLSSAALRRNGECSFLHIGNRVASSGGKAWKECWDVGRPLTSSGLADYEKYFAARNRQRELADLLALGVTDEPIPNVEGKPPKGARPPPASEKAIGNSTATTAWTGLQSFTGDYDLQVEYPRDAGQVLARLLSRVAAGNRADVLCEDGTTRQFIFRYYADNGMWRLNVPNSTPGVSWAREHKDGIAMLEVSEDDKVSFRILTPGRELGKAVNRSLALGTWGKTSTRLYGWY